MRMDTKTGIINRAYSILVLLVLVGCLHLFITGCKTDGYIMTFERIDNLLFTKVAYVKLITESSRIRTLNSQEIVILRASIKNATNLLEIDDKKMPIIDTGSKVIAKFIIKWDDGWSTNILRPNEPLYVYI